MNLQGYCIWNPSTKYSRTGFIYFLFLFHLAVWFIKSPVSKDKLLKHKNSSSNLINLNCILQKKSTISLTMHSSGDLQILYSTPKEKHQLHNLKWLWRAFPSFNNVLKIFGSKQRNKKLSIVKWINGLLMYWTCGTNNKL